MTVTRLARRPRGIRSRATAAALVVVASTAAIVLGIASAASAHVRVSSDDATRGGYAVLTFRVPTESATASTTELRVTFPASHPIVSVSTQPMPGWTARVTSKRLATPIKTDDGEADSYVAQVDWKADSARDAIPPGEFQMFNVSAGPLPDVDALSFPALQYYSDGSTVNWNEATTGSAEPAHPAPVLQIAAAGNTGADTSGASAAPSVSAATGSSMKGMRMSGDSGSSWPGIAGLVAGVLGLLLGGVALARTSRPTGSS